jgi:drug/metabolite transporter (DMT)-like permease
VLAVLLSLGSAVLFGGLSVAVRWGQSKGTQVDLGVAATIGVASLGVVAATLVAGPREYDLGELWPFMLVGLGVPGVSQFIFQRAIRAGGASRPTVVIGATPLISVAIALVFLDEPLRWPLLLGTVLVVAGTTLLATESGRPEHVRLLGLVLAGICTVLFATRDNLVRVAAEHVSPPAIEAGAASVVAGSLLGWTIMLVLRGRDLLAGVRSALPAMLPAGLCFAGAYVLLVAALANGRVSVVAPLNATQSLWTVALTPLFLGRSEQIGRRLVLSALFVLAGSALIGSTR